MFAIEDSVYNAAATERLIFENGVPPSTRTLCPAASWHSPTHKGAHESSGTARSLRAALEPVLQKADHAYSRRLRRQFASSVSRQARARPKRGGALEIGREIRR
jgi:hypothetical protein